MNHAHVLARRTQTAIAIAFTLSLSSCTTPATNPQSAKTQSTDVPTAMLANQPELGSFGIDLTARKQSIHPGDDFFLYANGHWIDTFEIPADKTRSGAFNVLIDRVDDRIRALIEEIAAQTHPQGTLEQKIGDYFNSYLDLDSINAAGLSPLASELDTIDAIDSVPELVDVFARSEHIRAGSPLRIGIGIDRRNTNRYQVGLGVSGLGLPDRDYYLLDEERFLDIRKAYESHIAEILTAAAADGRASRGANAPSASKQASQIIALETRLAQHHWPRADRRDRDKTYNPHTVAELIASYPGIDWTAFLRAAQFDSIKDLNISQPSSMLPIIDLINDTPIAVWRSYLRYHLLANYASMLPTVYDESRFDFYGRTLRGQPEQRPRWKRAISQIGGRGESLGEALGKLYVERHFPESAKRQMDELVANLLATLKIRIERLDWMTDATKAEAQTKLATFDPRIGYPDQWRDYSELQIDPSSAIENARRVHTFFFNAELARLHMPTDKAEWFFNTPQTVNASYSPSFNQITFPAGILQPPFFDPNADPAVNYGAIGAVIGHEIGHGFDDQGSKTDANGVQRNWWTDEDRAAFETRATTLVEQYNGYEAVPGAFVDGRFTLGENIGDLGGLIMALEAYKLSLNGEEAPIIEGLTGEQRFFMAFAQAWRSKIREEALLTQIKSDPHAPARFRVNGVVRNLDEWYEAFDIPKDSELYLAPEQRVRIW